ncbi:hypothetical protein HDV01_004578 [Terramyces sp. JEL0728]|nr:hypothetical protein HDV01_004578 [Terramyces sp. JEL0728]
MQISTALNVDEWFGLQNAYPTPTSEFPSEAKYTDPPHNPIDSKYPTPISTEFLNKEAVIVRKRQKQNEAARRCRAKKANELSEYKDLVTKLQNQLFEKDIRLAIIEKERVEWQKREQEYTRQIEMLKKERDDCFTLANLRSTQCSSQ